MGRPKKIEKATHLGFRADAESTRRLDYVAIAMGDQLGGVEISRSQVLKLCVDKMLPMLEYEYAAGAPTMTERELERFLKLRLVYVTGLLDELDAEGGNFGDEFWGGIPGAIPEKPVKKSTKRTK